MLIYESNLRDKLTGINVKLSASHSINIPQKDIRAELDRLEESGDHTTTPEQVAEDLAKIMLKADYLIPNTIEVVEIQKY